MHAWVRTAVLLLLASSAAAQHLGDPFPLTATRYGTARAHAPLLLSNGADPVLFWSDEQSVRVSRSVNGRFGMSRAVAGLGFDGTFDALWTGTHFLVVSGGNGLTGRLLDAAGEPLGDTFRIAERGWAPRIAFNGRNVLLLYVAPIAPAMDFGLHAFLLTPRGRPAEAEPRSLGVAPDGRVALASNGDTFAALSPDASAPALLFFDASGRLQSRSVFAEYGAGVAIATDGHRYLGVAACAGNRVCMTAVSRLIEADGTAGTPVELDPPLHFNPSVVWSGTKWLISYLRDVHLFNSATLQVVQLDALGRAVERREQRPAFEASLGTIGNRVLAAWTSGRYRDVIHVGPVPFDTATSVPASFTAKPQTLSAIASSNRGTLAVWQERGDGRTTLHTGFRTLDGRWRERELLSVAPNDCFFCYEEGVDVLLAGNGEEFMLQTAGVLRRLDGDGNPLGEPFTLPFFIAHLLWDGRDYLLFHGDRSVSRMTPGGTLTSTVTLPALVGQSSHYAVGGDGGLIAVRIERIIAHHEQRVAGLSVVRLDRDFNAIDATPIRLAADDQGLTTARAGWDGRQYVVAWSGSEGVMAAQLGSTPKVVHLGPGSALKISIEAVPGGAAVLWNEGLGPNRLAFLRHDGTSTAPLIVSGREDRGYDSGEIAPLPNGDLAYVESSLQEPAPSESTARVVFRVVSSVPLPPKPSAPRLTVQNDVLTWIAPLQPVDGFRLEARIDGGPWTEIAPPLDRDARMYRVPLEPGSHYAFRIRAWNESGTGAYFVAGAAPPSRRRAVR